MSYKLNPFTGKLDGVCECPAGGGGTPALKYAVGYDAAQRGLKSNTPTWETNLIVSLDVSANDIILVDMYGWFKTANKYQTMYAWIDVYEGLLTSLVGGGTITTKVTVGRAHTSRRLFSSGSSQTVKFAMIWYSTHYYYEITAKNRVVVARVIGHT